MKKLTAVLVLVLAALNAGSTLAQSHPPIKPKSIYLAKATIYVLLSTAWR
jgi:hypothetical protein